MNYKIVSYLICGVLITAVDFAVHTVLRNVDVGVGVSQASSWLAAVLLAYVVNKLIVFHNHNIRPSYFTREVGILVAARAFSGVVMWVPMMITVRLGGDGGFIRELFCKFTSPVINMVLNYVFSRLWIFKGE